MTLWSRLASGLAAAAAATILLAAPGGRTENVVLITTDGLRWQEVFGGAEESLMTKEAGGVSDPAELRRAFWRERPAARREALLPFLSTVLARQGQLYGNATRGSVARVTNGHNFSYPGYNELLSGRADPRIDSNDKKANPNVTVLEWLNGRPPYRGKVAAFCSWGVFPWIINRERSGVLVNAGFEPVASAGDRPRLAMLNQLLADTTPFVDSVRHDSFTYAADRLPGKQTKDLVVVVEVRAGDGSDRINDRKSAAQLDDIFEAVAQARLAAAAAPAPAPKP